MENESATSIAKKELENFFINSNIDIDFGNFFIALLLSLILAYLVKLTYIKVGRALNDKDYFSDTFIPLAIITTLVITVIKFSLASVLLSPIGICEPVSITALFKFSNIKLRAEAVYDIVSVPCKTTKLS